MRKHFIFSDSGTHFQQLKQQSSLLALAQVPLPGVTVLAVEDNVDVVDWFQVIRVTGLNLHHVPRHFNHTKLSRYPRPATSKQQLEFREPHSQ